MDIFEADVIDADTILSIQQAAYLSEAKRYNDYAIPPLRQTLDQLRNQFQNHTFLKAIVNSSLVGSVRAFQKNTSCYIGRLIVLPEFQGNGIGTQLLNEIEHCFNKVERFELFTGAQSSENLHLYKKTGYKEFKSKPLNEKITFIYLEKYINQPN